MITPNQHEKNEWARLAQAAYLRGRSDVSNRFRVAANLPDGTRLTTREFDMLQTDYRAWLIANILP